MIVCYIPLSAFCLVSEYASIGFWKTSITMYQMFYYHIPELKYAHNLCKYVS